MFSSKANVEDFIWAIRQRHQNIQEELKFRTNTVYDIRKNLDVSAFSENRTKILASLVPDEVIQNVNDYTHKNFDACLLFGDVSGFTELTEKYNQAGKGGASRLTLVLNGYIGALVQEIMSFGGDIFKFSGDAFLALWKCKEETQILRDYVHQAIDCALVIQKNYGTFQTDVGTYLRVKLAIAAGPVVFSLIGNEKYSHYIVLGKPVLDVKDAEKHSQAGEIIVAPSAWYHVNATDYLSVEIVGMFRKIIGVGPTWRHMKGENKRSLESLDEGMSDEDLNNPTTSEQMEMFVQKKNMEFALRPVMHQASENAEHLRKFILPPVMACIDGNEPIEYLIEMRRVVIMFINLMSKRASYDATASLINECYIEICTAAEKFRGCVNKVSLFDKDIMFVVIFGLRGFKHDLECQYALKCASRIYEVLNAHKELKTVSIACTTGKTYCGIVGHTLRREYTVMGLLVNKAARIMVNYPDRVTCDSFTFQHSKLEAKHFLLQIYKPLKGITTPGPVYEFQVSKTEEQAAVTVRYYPLLGRNTEVQTYLNYLKTFIKNAEKLNKNLPVYTRLMVIRGWPRQGKTRLLEEFVFITNIGLPKTRLVLETENSNVKYGTARLILYDILKISSSSSKIDLKSMIFSFLGKSYEPYLACLNELFHVDFEPSSEYLALSKKELETVFGRVIKNLCYAALPSVWLIAIDKGKNIDEYSWLVIIAMLSCRYVFFVMTLDASTMLGPVAKSAILHKNASILHLTNVPRIYHAGLACQILNVYAISADLENILHTKSNGNPGWIETLLISLKQSHHLFIRNADFRTVDQFGLVAPPLYFLRRMSVENIHKWEELLEEKNNIKKQRGDFGGDYWHLYIDTCRDEMVDVVLREKIHHMVTNENSLPVCFLNPKFDLMDIDAELSKEMRLVMTFDSLTYQEQLLLKCSSVLGDSFPRGMLVYVMQTEESSSRSTAKVVQSLFEKHVLCCAKGDFSEGGNYMLIREKMVDPSREAEIKCKCLGMYVNDDVKDLPKYASCGYLRFISTKFRQTTYNLLTDQQKKQFHSRAIKYLLRETKRCNSCGGAYFDLNGYCRLDDSRPKIVRKAVNTSPSVYTNLTDNEIDTSSSIMFPTARIGSFMNAAKKGTTTTTNTRGQSIGGSSFVGHSMLIQPMEEEEEDTLFNQKFGISNPFKVFQCKKNYSLTQTFTRADFQTCHCHLILTYLYNQLVHHHKGASNWLDMINSMTEYVVICIESKNFAEAYNITRKALNFIANSGESINIIKWQLPVLEAKLFTSLAKIQLENDQRDDSMIYFYKAMSNFGYSFPRTRLKIHINLMWKKLKQRLKIYFFPDTFINKKLGEENRDIIDSMSRCLIEMFNVFMNKQQMNKAELAAIWGLSTALEAQKNLIHVCAGFENVILIANYRKKRFWGVLLEVHALRFCHKKKFGIDPPEMRAVIRLYFTILLTRFARAEFNEALHIGYILSRLSVTSNDLEHLVKTFAYTTAMLCLKLFLSECTTILQEFSYHLMDQETASARVIFYTSAIYYHLSTGYNFVPMKEIEIFVKSGCVMMESLDIQSFLAILRAWYARTSRWEAAFITDSQLRSMAPAKSHEDVIHVNFCFNMLLEIEYQLLLLVYRMNKRNIKDIERSKEMIANAWKKIDQWINIADFEKPRYHLMKAYEAIIWNNESKMWRSLKKSKKYSIKQENLVIQKNVDFLEQYWMENLPDEEAERWLKHADSDEYVEFNQLYNPEGIMCYPYPLPLYI